MMELTNRIAVLGHRDFFDAGRWAHAVQGEATAAMIRLGAHIRDPLIMPLGVVGVDGVTPRFYIHDETDIRRIEFCAGERPMLEGWVRVIRSLPPDACVADIGAAAGAYALSAAFLLPSGTVVAVEPDPESFQRLCWNITLNCFDDRIMALPYAIGGSEHPVILYTEGANGPAPSLRDGRFEQSKTVPMCSLDDLVKRGIIPPPLAVKIDVEGAEVDPIDGVFVGMKAIMDKGYPWHIFLETHSAAMVEDFGGTTSDVLDMLDKRGYKEVFRLDRSKEAPLYHFVREDPM